MIDDLPLDHADGGRDGVIDGAHGDTHGVNDGGIDSAADGEPVEPNTFCQLIEAESGTLVPPMGKQPDPAGGAGECVATLRSEEGAVSFTFTPQRQGWYIVQVRVRCCANELGCDSFYVGLDNENAAGSNAHTYDMFNCANVWIWDNVSLRGGTLADKDPPEFDPKAYELSAEGHTFTFYGREAETYLDQVVLRACPGNAEDDCLAIQDFGCPADGGT